MKFSKNTKGFTIMEILVVIIIIAIVSTIGTNTYQNQRRQVRYNDSLLKVLSMIKQARNYAVSSRAVWDEGQQESYVPPEGYGVYIERSDTPGASRIVLFANTEIDNPQEQDQYDDGFDVIEEEYFLYNGVDFIGLSIDQILPNHTDIGGSDTDKAVVIFRPPLADATLAVNDNVAALLTTLDDLYLEFKQQEAHELIPSRYIHINKISGLAESERL